jgi:hypothetical protein
VGAPRCYYGDLASRLRMRAACRPALCTAARKAEAACVPALRAFRWPAESSGGAQGAAKAGGRKQGRTTAKSSGAKPEDANTEAAVSKPARKRVKRKA